MSLNMDTHKTSPMLIQVNTPNIIQSSHQQTGTLILFHDSGKYGEDLKQQMDFYNNNQELSFPHIRIIYPTAPIPVNVSGGKFPSWFDRDLMVHESPEVKHSIDIMCNKASEIIHREIARGIPMNRIIIGGFSRGGRLAMHLAYRFKKGLAGCIVMSSCLNQHSLVYESLKTTKSEECPELLMLHGNKDPKVSVDHACRTYETLQSWGVKGSFVRFPQLGHGMSPTEIEYIKNWVLKRLK